MSKNEEQSVNGINTKTDSCPAVDSYSEGEEKAQMPLNMVAYTDVDRSFSAWDGRELPPLSWRYGRYLRWDKGFGYYQRGVFRVAVPTAYDSDGNVERVKCPGLVVRVSSPRHLSRRDDSLHNADMELGLAKARTHQHPDLVQEAV